MEREEAIALAETDWWQGMSCVDIVRFQLYEPKLCMPYGVYHSNLTKAFGRPVYTHELAEPERLQAEFEKLCTQ